MDILSKIWTCVNAKLFNMFGDTVIRLMSQPIPYYPPAKVELYALCNGRWKWILMDDFSPYIIESELFYSKTKAMENAHAKVAALEMNYTKDV